MAVYLITDRETTLPLSALRNEPEAEIVLLGEGVYLGLKKLPSVSVYCLEEDAQKRGIEKLLPENIQKISHKEIIKLLEGKKVFCF